MNFLVKLSYRADQVCRGGWIFWSSFSGTAVRLQTRLWRSFWSLLGETLGWHLSRAPGLSIPSKGFALNIIDSSSHFTPHYWECAVCVFFLLRWPFTFLHVWLHHWHSRSSDLLLALQWTTRWLALFSHLPHNHLHFQALPLFLRARLHFFSQRNGFNHTGASFGLWRLYLK